MLADDVRGEAGVDGRTRVQASSSADWVGSYAGELVDRASRLNGLQPDDWAKLASVRRVTTSWSASVGEVLARCLSASGEQDGSTSALWEDLEQGAALWFDQVASGQRTGEVWAETAFLGLSHAALGVSNSTTLAFLNRLDSLLTLNCSKAFSSEQAIEVGNAFSRVLGVARVVMLHAHELGRATGTTQLGVNPHLMLRLRTESVPKMIGDAQASIAFMTWNDSLVTGVTELDDGHQELVERVERLHQARTTERGPELGQALQALADGLAEQVTREERLYAEHALPELERHRELHRHLVTRVLVFVEDWKTAPSSESVEGFARNLRGWLSEHLRVADRAAGAFLRSRGLR